MNDYKVTEKCPVCEYYGEMELVGDIERAFGNPHIEYKKQVPGVVCCPKCGVVLSVEILMRNRDKKPVSGTVCCPKCGGITEYNAYSGRTTCTHCDWESEKEI